MSEVNIDERAEALKENIKNTANKSEENNKTFTEIKTEIDESLKEGEEKHKDIIGKIALGASFVCGYCTDKVINDMVDSVLGEPEGFKEKIIRRIGVGAISALIVSKAKDAAFDKYYKYGKMAAGGYEWTKHFKAKLDGME